MEYYCVRDTFQACLLTRDSLKIVPVGSVSNLRRVLQLLRFQLSKFRLGPDYVKLFQSAVAGCHQVASARVPRALIAPMQTT